MPARVLSRPDAIALGQKLLDLVGKRSAGVAVEHVSRAVTRVANGKVIDTDDGDRVRIVFSSQFGSGLPVDITTDQLNDTTLRRVVDRVSAMAPPVVQPDEFAPVDYSDMDAFVYNARDFLPVSLWHNTTAEAMGTVRETVIPNIIDRVQSSRSPLLGAATIGFSARSVLHLYHEGLTAFSESTDSEVSVTARTPDGRASGWDGRANRDWSRLDTDAIARHAMDIADRSRGAVALEPGRRTVILGPAAVARLVCEMGYAFNWENVNAPPGADGTPFTFLQREEHGRRTRFGLRVVDPRLKFVSDPADPMGGFSPFLERWGIELNVHGFPVPAITWIDEGVLKHFAYAVVDGLGRNMPPCDEPYSVHVTTVPGTQTATIDEMIANCKEGVYVNRLSDVRVLDRGSGLMTGVTRDGSFFIKDGKIQKPITNLRFMDSPFFCFNKLEMIGTSERVAFGYSPSRNKESWYPWPRLPIVVPPMMIRDFNFSALANAV